MNSLEQSKDLIEELHNLTGHWFTVTDREVIQKHMDAFAREQNGGHGDCQLFREANSDGQWSKWKVRYGPNMSAHDYRQCLSVEQAAERLDELSQLKEANRELLGVEKEGSDAYLRVRALLNAYDTNHGGENRYEVTENCIRELLKDKERLDHIQKTCDGDLRKAIDEAIQEDQEALALAKADKCG